MRTVFVIGAGANTEIGMPSGDELKTKIADILNFTSEDNDVFYGDGTICDALNLYSRDRIGVVNTMKLDSLVEAAMDISKAMPLSISIDNFIDARRGDPQIAFCGKLAIVSTIFEAEYNCALSVINNKTVQDELAEGFINPSTVEDAIDAETERLNRSWYPLLFQKITEGCSIEELADRLDNISFIIFNYDRCFEYFMFLSLLVYYNISYDRAKEIVLGLHINHPYGAVGNLWDSRGNLTFGEIPNSDQLIVLAQNIKTFTESREREKDMKSTVQYYVERADRIVFLGFAYYEQNIDLLFNNKGVMIDNIPPANNTVCYGTGYQISEYDLPKVLNLLRESNKKISECIIPDIKCAQFFQKFSHSLSFKDAQTDQAGTPLLPSV
jgi:hypothetical protein